MRRKLLVNGLIGCFFCTMLFVFPVLSVANESLSSDSGVTLQQALEDITKSDPAILEAVKNYESVLAEVGIAESEYYPVIGTNITVGPERTDGIDTNDEEENLISTTATLYVRQNLFNGGKTTAFVRETDARVQAAAYEVLKVANDIYLETAEAYINVVKARNLLVIAEENALTQEKIMRQVREKTNAGFNRVSELYNSESRLALSKGSFISRQQDLNQALVMFHKRFGRFLGSAQFIEPVPTYEPPATLPENIDLAFQVHPALKVAEYNIETSRYAFEKSEADDFPTLDLELRGQYREDTGGDEGDTDQLGAYLTFNYKIWDGGLRSSQQQRDRAKVRKENQRSYIERRNLNESVRLAWNIMEAEQFKNKYLGDHVNLSAKTLGAFKEEYFVGRRTLLDLLNMENEYTDAKLSYSESEFSHLIALYRLMQATGVLLDEHDTGLRTMLGLPEADYGSIFKDINKSEVKAYEDLAENRDVDQQIDAFDQCDNSKADSGSEQYGCVESNANIAGYPHADDAQLEPYIIPQTFDNDGSVNTDGFSSSGSSKEAHSNPLANSTATPVVISSGDTIVLPMQPNSDALTRVALKRLGAVKEYLLTHSGAKVLLEGYVASDNNSEAHKQLSLKRTAKVQKYLLQQGVLKENITVIGRGAENPVASNSTREGRRKNRRVEVTISDD